MEEVVTEAAGLVPNVYLRKGSTLIKNKDFAGAATALKQVIALTPDDDSAYLLLGQALIQTNDLPGATEALEKAAELGKADQANKLLGNAYLKEGQALLKANKTADAIGAYKKYLEITPNAKDASDIIFTIAATAQKAGDKATAKEYYNKIASDAKYGAQAQAQLKAL